MLAANWPLADETSALSGRRRTTQGPEQALVYSVIAVTYHKTLYFCELNQAF